MIKGICFDLDGVYFTGAGIKGFIRELTSRCGDEQKALHAMLWDKEVLDFKKGLMTEEAFWEYVNSFLSLKLSVQEYATLLVTHYEIDPNIRTIVQKTKQLGYHSLICSNNYPTRVHALQEKFHFLEDFDAAVFSFEVGVMKPDIMIFKELISKSGLQANEIVYADDQADKISGAQSLGINTAIYTTFEAYQQFLISLGVQL